MRSVQISLVRMRSGPEGGDSWKRSLIALRGRDRPNVGRRLLNQKIVVRAVRDELQTVFQFHAAMTIDFRLPSIIMLKSQHRFLTSGIDGINPSVHFFFRWRKARMNHTIRTSQ